MPARCAAAACHGNWVGSEDNWGLDPLTAWDVQEIATRAGCDADAVSRLLRFLSSLGIFEEAGPRCYRNNKTSAHLRRDHPQCVRSMILMHNSDIMSRPWYEQLEAGVREGVPPPPFVLAHGEALFNHLNHQPEFDKLFSEAMDSVDALTGDTFAIDFNWSRFGRIIDVGGSRGEKSLAIVRCHPSLEALIVDRPQVINEARRHWVEHPVPGSERLQFAAPLRPRRQVGHQGNEETHMSKLGDELVQSMAQALAMPRARSLA